MGDNKYNDPALYRRMSEPFPDSETANDAVQAFFAGVEKLREQHRISDVLVLAEIGVMTDGTETRGAAQLFRGSRANIMPMLARAYGAERQRHEDDLALLMAAARGQARK